MTRNTPADPQIFSAAYYDRLREIEERHWWSAGMRSIEERLVRAHAPERALDVLDAGCGTGGMLGWLERFSGGRPVEGIEVSPEAIDHCRRRGHARVRQGSVLELPYPDGSFDLVHSGDVLQHLPADGGAERALAEARRVLRRSGLLFVRTNAEPRGGGRAGAAYQRFDQGTLRGRIEAAGFDVLHVSYVSCLPSLVDELFGRGPSRTHGEHGPDGDRGLRIRLLPALFAWLGRLLGLILEGEARHVARGGTLPFGHTLVGLARRAD